MVRIIERSTVKNKELFDKLWARSGGHTQRKVFPSEEMLMMFAQVLRMTLIPAPLMGQMHAYTQKYPYTMLINA